MSYILAESLSAFLTDLSWADCKSFDILKKLSMKQRDIDTNKLINWEWRRTAQNYYLANGEVLMPHDVIIAAKKYNKLLPNGKIFCNYIHFSHRYLKRLPMSIIKYCKDNELPEIFPQVANDSNPTKKARRKYLEALLNAYKIMENELFIDSNTLLIAPQREGSLLVKKLKWNKLTNKISFPHAKRIPYKSGIVIGLGEIKISKNVKRVVIVDGAIASASTLMAIMLSLKDKRVKEISIFSVHGTEEGLIILDKFSTEYDINLKVYITYVSGILNEKYYAVYPDDLNRLIVGDLGDTISDLF